MGLEIVAERVAEDILHGVVHSPVIGSAVINRNDVGVAQLGGQCDLTLKSAPRCFCREWSFKENFQCDNALGGKLNGFVNQSHPTATDELLNLISWNIRYGCAGFGKRMFCGTTLEFLFRDDPGHGPSINSLSQGAQEMKSTEM